MKLITCGNQYSFSDPFTLPDGNFGCVEQFDDIANRQYIFQTINLNTGERHWRFVSKGYSEIYYSSKGLIFSKRKNKKTQYYDLLSGKRVGSTKCYFDINSLEFCIHKSNIILKCESRTIPSGSTSLISKIIDTIENYNGNKIYSVIICNTETNDIKIFDVGFYIKSVLISPDGLTALAHSNTNSVIIDLE